MPFGAMRHGFTYQPAAAGGGGITSTTAFTLTSAVTGVYSAYGGNGPSQITWQGVFNTNYGVFLVSSLGTSRLSYKVTVGVVDLTNGSIATGTPQTFSTTNSGASTWFAVAAKPGSNFGLLAGPEWTGTDWDTKYYGYTLSGTSTATTSSIPTISFSSALTDTQNNTYSGNLAYAGNDRFVFVNRYGSQDLSSSHYISYAGSGTPSYFHNTVNWGGSRSTGKTVSFYDGLSSTLASSFSNTNGNNNNFTDLYITCASSSAEAEFEDNDRLDCSPTSGVSGAAMTCAKAYDTSGTWVGLSGIYSSQANQKLVAEKCTTLSSSSIAVTSGSVYSQTTRIDDYDTLDPVNGKARGITQGGSGTWMVDIDVDSSTLAVSVGTAYQVSTSALYNGGLQLRNLKDATHGEWSLFSLYNSGNLDITAVKVV